MYDLLTRTASQVLQGFVPIAVAWAWYRASAGPIARDARKGIAIGVAAVIPGTVLAAYLFQVSTRQSQVEAALAAAATAIACWFAGVGVRRTGGEVAGPPSRTRWMAFASGTLLLALRQSMEIGVAAAAIVHLAAFAFGRALAAGAAIGIAAAFAWIAVARRNDAPALRRATLLFAVLFGAQAAFYALHEAAESRLLPASAALHAATEPYGPDGLYGRYISAIVVLVPLGVLLAGVRSWRVRDAAGTVRSAAPFTSRERLRWIALAAIVVLTAAAAITMRTRHPADTTPLSAATDVDTEALGRTLASPHLLVRLTSTSHYGRLGVVPLSDAPGTPVPAAISCDRVGYAGGQGMCLVTGGGPYTSYVALFFDRALNVTRRIELNGRPSRTRVSPDGRFGAMTVFEPGFGHEYALDGFATRTALFDLRDGSVVVGSLEWFAATRDGRRFSEQDFNYWGVTFTHDSRIFYATLQTGGTRYLVRGDVSQRTVTVLRENVECPAISPDNHHLAYKKRVGTGQDPWRFYVLDLDTMQERALGETRSIDDQLEWLDDAHVLYGAPRAAQGRERDVWVAPIDGSAPSLFLPDAESPVVVR